MNEGGGIVMLRGKKGERREVERSVYLPHREEVSFLQD
jgi:hypothetical protein